jgi:outer membrane protein assembly complex protein YaeT
MAGVVLVGLCAAHGQPAAESSNLIVDVKVEGNKVTSVSSVLGGVKTRPGQTLDEKLIKEDEQRLLKTGRYETVHAIVTRGPQGVAVTFVVSERPLVAKIVFRGNKVFKSEELMKDFPFGVNDPLNQYNAEAGRQAIISKYQAKGYYYADVKIDPAALRDQSQIVYTIVEGPKVAVKAIKFKGNDFFWDIELRMEIGQGQEWWPFTTGALDSEQVDRDVTTIRAKYASEGFLDADVGRLIEFAPDQKSVALTFVIKEGPRYRVNNITFRGNTIYSDTELYKRLLMKQGEFYTAQGLKRDVTVLEGTYGEVGFIYAVIVPKKLFVSPAEPPPAWAAKLKERGKPALVNLIYEIRELDQFHIGRIDIKGNTLTQARVIRRELRFYPEQLYNTVAVEESKHRLMEARIFDKVDITPEGDEPGVRNPLVKVAEGKSANFMVGVGVSSNEGLLGNVSVTQRNFNILGWPKNNQDITEGRAFKGAGQTLTLAVQPGTEMTSIHADWFEPYMFDLPYTLGASIFYFDAQRPLRETYNETRYGVTGSVGHRFDNGWYAEFATRAEDVWVHDLTDRAPPEVRADAGTNFLLGLKGSLTKDRTDSRWTPTTGDRFTIAYEEVTGDFNFGVASADYKIYRTVYVDALDRKHVLMGHLSIGDIVGGIAPVYEKFYGGGIGSIRGFQYRGISPRSANSDEQIGGRFSAFAGTQYEFPLITTLVRGVVFVDSGTVENDFGVTFWRASVGTGVRLVLPILGQVPIAADVAIPILHEHYDNIQYISFNMGVTF